MAMNYKEVPNSASQADQQEYATGIARMASLAKKLHSQGLLPERFSPEPFRFHPSLEGKINIQSLTVGGKTGKELLRELGRKHINVGSYAKSMVESGEFTTAKEPQQVEIGFVNVGDMVPSPKGSYATTAEFEQSRDEKGLMPVSADTALAYLLQHGDELKVGDVVWMSMNTIADRDGDPDVFDVARSNDGLWLRSHWTEPSDSWLPGDRFAVGLPQENKA